MSEKNIDLNKTYWDNFYKTNFKSTPSQFCVCMLTEIDPTDTIVELGSGNGRDSLYFASQGHITVAMDLSHEAIASCEREAKERQVEHTSFFQGDLTNLENVSSVIQHARDKSESSMLTFYSRFVMHSLDDEQERKLLEILSSCLQAGEKIYFEFRSSEDAELDKVFGNHFRRYINIDAFHARLENGGFNISYSLVGQGMAKYKEEDPFVARIIACKK
ncbi:MAG: class I SAM-dependent methyltransferase [Pseudomonadales bacterium]|nr:class I SAM-dependent methyltransferase [Pseudomonadales bacterium]